MFITLRHKKDLAPLNAGVPRGLFLDDQTNQPSLPEDPPPQGGGSPPTSVSDAMVTVPVQISV